MEISNQHRDDVFRIGRQHANQLSTQKQISSSEQFGDILQNALATQQQSSQQAQATSLLPRTEQADMISKMLLQPLNRDQTAAPEPELLQRAFENASGTLDLWDSYARTLESSNNGQSLRDAYSILEDIGAQVAQLKSNTASFLPQENGLRSLINELDILATTERIKFNRGDYA